MYNLIRYETKKTLKNYFLILQSCFCSEYNFLKKKNVTVKRKC